MCRYWVHHNPNKFSSGPNCGRDHKNRRTMTERCRPGVYKNSIEIHMPHLFFVLYNSFLTKDRRQPAHRNFNIDKLYLIEKLFFSCIDIHHKLKGALFVAAIILAKRKILRFLFRQQEKKPLRRRQMIQTKNFYFHTLTNENCILVLQAARPNRVLHALLGML